MFRVINYNTTSAKASLVIFPHSRGYSATIFCKSREPRQNGKNSGWAALGQLPFCRFPEDLAKNGHERNTARNGKITKLLIRRIDPNLFIRIAALVTST
ncbi:MAG: hypothetical protein A3C47_04340 [Omnitrophica bacterium RIFCSPHIGHO2_02_FULL_51_18]|nr:MAG: hypothetical protein A3C47_04340 [Omnitrophica bacterium RIFCSPHIGHO2_02_FULL_51_18]